MKERKEEGGSGDVLFPLSSFLFPLSNWQTDCCTDGVAQRRGGWDLQYTIEARELTNEYTQRSLQDVPSRRLTVEAEDADAAISQYVRECDGELVSCHRPARGLESIATVKKEDAVFLVRVYAA
jgi:hypothetical protein